ncbi:MAG: type II toxin-antitoxin system RelE/ParE family toxin [Gemmataceae bacterium]|nr:type II toxin-antitoxin system RelE/ParE family toxin [Gemmataceae bacterium]
MTTPVDFERLAIREARQAERRYARVGAGVLAGFTAALNDAVARVGSAPAMWPPEPHGARGCRLKKYPYRLIYIEEPTRVLVLAVAHNSRRQGYWRRRLPP